MLESSFVSVQGVAHVEHLVLCVVHDGLILARHTFVEGVLHHVVEQGLHDVEGNLLDIEIQVILGHRFIFGIAVHQTLTTTMEKVFLHSLIVGDEHGGHIVFCCRRGTDGVLVPSRVVGQRGEYAERLLVGTCRHLTALRTVGDVSLLEYGVVSDIEELAIFFGQVVVIIRCAETLKECAEITRRSLGVSLKCFLRTVLTNHLSHIVGRENHLVYGMDITIQADNILLQDAAAVDVAAVFCFGIVVVANDEADITMLDILLLHLSFKEVGHHGHGLIHYHVHTAAGLLTIRIPEPLVTCVVAFGIYFAHVEVFGQVAPVPEAHAIQHGCRRGLAQTQVLTTARCIGEHLHHVGVVEHTTVQKEFLLRCGQLFVGSDGITIDAYPTRGAIECLVRIITGSKNRLTTSLG